MRNSMAAQAIQPKPAKGHSRPRYKPNLTFRRSRVAFGRNFLMEIVGGSGLAGWFCVDETLGFDLPRVHELLHLTIVRNRDF